MIFLKKNINKILNSKKSHLVEITLQDGQFMMPRLQSTKNDDGTITSGSLENMWPYLDSEIFEKIKKTLNN